MEILKIKKENLEILEDLVFWFKRGLVPEFTRVYLDQFFWAITIYRLN